MMQNPFLIGEQLYLRPLEPDQDSSKLAEWYNYQEFHRYFSSQPQSGPAKSIKSLGRQTQSKLITVFGDHAHYKDFLDGLYKTSKLTVLGVALKSNNSLIGVVGLKDVTIGFIYQTAELCVVINPQEQGKGYDTEVTQLILHYGFMEQNWNRIETFDRENNLFGWRVDEKLGFQFESIRREAFFCDGQYYNVHMYSMLRREYIELFRTSHIYTNMRDIFST
jgi:RimJ/RimL family protein N-acetyltransferase